MIQKNAPVSQEKAGRLKACPVEGDRRRAIWARLAESYDQRVARAERGTFAGGREWVCRRASGVILEIAVGSGRNLAFYPAGSSITGIDFSPQMLQLARRRAAELNLAADLRLGDAQALEFPDSSFDTVVCTLGLCSVPDHVPAIREACRVLKPGGHFLLLEHVASDRSWVRIGQRLVELWTLRMEGDHQLRRPLAVLKAEGFEILEEERLKLGIVHRIDARRPALAAVGAAATAGTDPRRQETTIKGELS
ncbi:MAG TPA: class I SAM-dependent methyltransferase [Candidatus Dormibacteraeota bacterium]|nr:class I SAM-dependent methyltransferase [Candidatus Dormibacteraeota bacterium]